MAPETLLGKDIKVGSVWEKTGSRWTSSKYKLIIVISNRADTIYYRFLNPHAPEHGESGPFGRGEFLRQCTEVTYD